MVLFRWGIEVLIFGIPLLFLMCDCGFAEEKKAGALKSGKEIFHERCAACHGVDGVPILPGTPEFAKGERLDKSDEELLKTIMHGKDQMPAWKETLSKQECKNVLTYVKVMVGEKVFEEKCLKCHSRGTPSLRSDVPKDSELKDLKEPLDLCKGCDIDKELSNEEMIGVIRYIRALSASGKNKK